MDPPRIANYFLHTRAETSALHCVDAPSRVLSLERRRHAATIHDVFPAQLPLTTNNVTMHRFDETINGRAYRIEVSGVGLNQWRAQIARTSGGSRALMPFYGSTPDEAAQQLIRWLSMAHGTHSRGAD